MSQLGEPSSQPTTLELDEGRAFLEAGRFDDALKTFDHVLDADADNAEAHLEAGRAAFFIAQARRAGDDARMASEYFANAEQHLAAAASLDPASSEAQIEWGRTLVAEGKTEQGLWCFDRARELRGGVEPLLEAGEALLSAAKTEETDPVARQHAARRAEERFSLAVKESHGAGPAWYGLGRAHEEQREYQEALTAFKAAIAADASDLEIRVALGRMENQLERYAAARDIFQQTLQADDGDGLSLYPAIEARLGLVTALTRLRNWEEAGEALGALEEWARGWPRGRLDELRVQIIGVVRVLDSVLLTELGRFGEAIESAAEARRIGGSTVFRALTILVALHRARGEYGRAAELLLEAEEELSRHTSDESELVVMTLLESEILQARDKVPDAVALLEKRSREHPQELELHMRLVELVARELATVKGSEATDLRHRLSLAIRRARDVLATRNLPSAQFTLGALEVFDGNAAEAHETLLRAVEKDPESDEGHGLLGIASAAQGDHASAAESFARASRRAPVNLGYRLGLAAAYTHLKNVDGAEGIYRDILETAPMNVEALVGLGAVLGRQEDPDATRYSEAASALQRALRAAATMRGDLSHQRASLRLSSVQRAEIYYQIGVARTRQYEASGSSRARPSELLNDAKQAFSRALREDPASFRARRAKAQVNLTQRELTPEKAPLLLQLSILGLLALATSAFMFELPQVVALTGDVYAVVALGLLVLLIATLYLPQLRRLSVVGVSLEKDAEVIDVVTKLGIEENPGFIELIKPEVNLPPAPEFAGAKSSTESRAQASGDAEHGARPRRDGAVAGLRDQALEVADKPTSPSDDAG